MSEDIGVRIGKFEKNDASLTKLEVMSGEGINNSMIERIAAALASNTHCVELLLKGCNMSTDNAKSLAPGLATNATLKKIDFESNRIDPAGIVAIATALRENQSLTEVRLQNQKSQFGNEAETAIADMMEVNSFIEKIPLTLKNGGARVRVNKYETRNRDYNRRRKKGETIPGVPAGSAPAASSAPVASSSAAPAASSTTAAAPSSADAAKKKAEEEAKKKADADAAAKKKAEEDAKKKAEEEAKKKAEADAAAKKKAEADATAAKQKAEAEAAAKKKAEDEAAAKKKAEEDAKKAAPAPAASNTPSADEKKAVELLTTKADAILARIDAVLNKIGA